MSRTIRTRPFYFRHLGSHQVRVAGGWKNRTIPQDLLDGDYADKYPSDEGDWQSNPDHERRHITEAEQGWLEQTQFRRARLHRVTVRRQQRQSSHRY